METPRKCHETLNPKPYTLNPKPESPGLLLQLFQLRLLELRLGSWSLETKGIELLSLSLDSERGNFKLFGLIY